jgi:hypothetical protein
VRIPDAENGIITPEIEEQVMLNEFKALLRRVPFYVPHPSDLLNWRRNKWAQGFHKWP